MQKILLDTNFLLGIYQFKVDIFSQIDKILSCKYEFCVLDKTIGELKKVIEKQKGKNNEAAKIALRLLAIKNIGVIKTGGYGKTDDIILEFSSKNNFVVATLDKELRKRLRGKNIPVLILKRKKIVSILGIL